MAAFRGSCLCGEVAFEVEGPFDRFLNCHCSRCRKATGTAHACEAIIHAGAFDQPLGTVPDRHVQWASRADWYAHGDRLPVED